MRTVPGVLRERIRSRPSAEAVFDASSGESLDYAAFDRETGRWARLLASRGLGPGDRAAFALPDGVRAFVALAGAIRAGVAPLPLDSRLREGEAVALAASCAAPVIGAEHARALPPGDASPAWPDPDPEATAVIWATSGTTGRSKGVCVPHRAALARWEANAAAFGFGEDLRFLSVLPLAAGFLFPGLYSLSHGGTVIFCAPDLEAASFSEAVARSRANALFLVPALVRKLIAGRREAAGGLKGVRTAVCATARLDPAAEEAFEEAFGIPLLDCYGLTETGFITYSPRARAQRRPGSVGRALRGEVRIEDEDGRPLPPGVRGQVAYRGATLAIGYCDGAGIDRAAFEGGWFRTKDEGALDPEGRLSLYGRLDGAIMGSGCKVSPEEVEAALASHPSVAEAAVLGVPGPLGTERVAACVVPRPGRLPSEEELRAHCRERLADFKCPEKIVIVPEIPKTATRKPRRRDLASLFRAPDGSAGP